LSGGDDSGPGLEALRKELVNTAKARGTLTYGQLMKIMGISRDSPSSRQ